MSPPPPPPPPPPPAPPPPPPAPPPVGGFTRGGFPYSNPAAARYVLSRTSGGNPLGGRIRGPFLNVAYAALNNLSVPSYVVGNLAHGRPLDALKVIFTRGMVPKYRRSVSSAPWIQRFIPDNNWGSAAELLIDIGTDPLSYASAGFVGAARQGSRRALAAAGGEDSVTRLRAQIRKMEDDLAADVARDGRPLPIQEVTRRAAEIASLQKQIPKAFAVGFRVPFVTPSGRIGLNRGQMIRVAEFQNTPAAYLRARARTLDTGEVIDTPASRLGRQLGRVPDALRPSGDAIGDLTLPWLHATGRMTPEMAVQANLSRNLRRIVDGALLRQAHDIQKRGTRLARQAKLQQDAILKAVAFHVDDPTREPLPRAPSTMNPAQAKQWNKDLDDLVSEVKASLVSFRNAEIDAGIREALVSNYVPHVIVSTKERRRFAAAFGDGALGHRGMINPGFSKERWNPPTTLRGLVQRGEEMGFTPETNIARLLQIRGQASMRAVHSHAITNNAYGMFALKEPVGPSRIVEGAEIPEGVRVTGQARRDALNQRRNLGENVRSRMRELRAARAGKDPEKVAEATRALREAQEKLRNINTLLEGGAAPRTFPGPVQPELSAARRGRQLWESTRTGSSPAMRAEGRRGVDAMAALREARVLMLQARARLREAQRRGMDTSELEDQVAAATRHYENTRGRAGEDINLNLLRRMQEAQQYLSLGATYGVARRGWEGYGGFSSLRNRAFSGGRTGVKQADLDAAAKRVVLQRELDEVTETIAALTEQTSMLRRRISRIEGDATDTKVVHGKPTPEQVAARTKEIRAQIDSLEDEIERNVWRRADIEEELEDLAVGGKSYDEPPFRDLSTTRHPDDVDEIWDLTEAEARQMADELEDMYKELDGLTMSPQKDTPMYRSMIERLQLGIDQRERILKAHVHDGLADEGSDNYFDLVDDFDPNDPTKPAPKKEDPLRAEDPMLPEDEFAPADPLAGFLDDPEGFFGVKFENAPGVKGGAKPAVKNEGPGYRPSSSEAQKRLGEFFNNDTYQRLYKRALRIQNGEMRRAMAQKMEPYIARVRKLTEDVRRMEAHYVPEERMTEVRAELAGAKRELEMMEALSRSDVRGGLHPFEIRQGEIAKRVSDDLTELEKQEGIVVLANRRIQERAGREPTFEEWQHALKEWAVFEPAIDYHGGSRIPLEIAEDLKRIYKQIQPELNLNAMGQASEFIFQLTSRWKALALLSPGYHTRNMMDDGLRMWFGGARNPLTFAQAILITAGKELNRKYKLGGKEYTGHDVRAMLETMGLTRTGVVGADIEATRTGTADLIGKKRYRPRSPGRGKGTQFSAWVGNFREDATRTFFFMEMMKRGDSMVEAAQQTRWWLFDYGEVGKFVETARRFWIPFVTYPSKALPQTIKLFATRPGYAVNVGRVVEWMQVESGLSGEDLQNLPDYFKDAVPVPSWIPGLGWALGTEGDEGFIFDPSRVMGAATLGLLDKDPKGVGQNIFENVNPVFGLIAGTTAGYDTFRQRQYGEGDRVWAPAPIVWADKIGIPIAGFGPKLDSATGQYFPGYSPRLAAALNIIPAFGQASRTIPSPRSGSAREGLFKYLTGIPVTPYDKALAAYYAQRNRRGGS